MAALGWDFVDVVLVTGDACIDHPSFGVALIGRLLESRGYRVAILAQPRHDGPEDFRRFGRPRLFFGISAGNLDSIVANYSGNAKVRDRDDYSPGGNPYFGDRAEKSLRRRPDRASIVYGNLARAAYPEATIILGGIEASLRRFVHYDYQQQRLRGSVLTDAKADLLIYGMGERAALAAAGRLAKGENLAGISGTCERMSDREMAERVLPQAAILPSWEEIRAAPARFLKAELAIERIARAGEGPPLAQRQQAAWVLQHPPAAPLSSAELDALYSLPFTRRPHPSAGEVPAWRMIRDSITIVRGCCGNCSFCAISRHQGPVIVSRGQASVLAEVTRVAKQRGFSGTISDLGGPTANLYGAACSSPKPCRRHDCLFPKICRFFKPGEQEMLDLLGKVSACEGVKRVFVSSGLRMELLLKTPRLLRRLLMQHTPGVMKIAPEHTEAGVLRLMHKPGPEVLSGFLALCRKIGREEGRAFQFNPYLISAFPGCTRADMERMAESLVRLGLVARQPQDFTPTPGTLATASFVTGLDCESGQPLFVARSAGERRAQRQAIEDGGGAEPGKGRPEKPGKTRRGRKAR